MDGSCGRGQAAEPDAGGPDRLVASPVLVLCTTRSGSTLLRCLLDAHPAVRAPHELHLPDLRVQLASPYVQMSLDVAGLTVQEVEHLLWDRLLHRELARSGKQVIVDKTPGNVLVWDRLARAWPAARFIFLLRHPANVLASALEAGPDRDPRELTAQVLRHLTRLQQARQTLSGLTVRYEELTSDPERVTRELCGFLDLPWTPQMLDYGAPDHDPHHGPRDGSGRGPFLYGIGDWGPKIRTGRVVAGRPLPPPEQVPQFLLPFCAAWDYPAAGGDTGPTAAPVD